MIRAKVFGLTGFLLLATSISTSVGADEPAAYWHENLDVAWKVARVLERPLLVVVSTDACVACSQLKRVTLRDANVVSEIRRSFVAASADAASYPQLMESLRIATYPTTLVIAPDRRVVDAIAGFVPPEEMQNRLRGALNSGLGHKPDK